MSDCCEHLFDNKGGRLGKRRMASEEADEWATNGSTCGYAPHAAPVGWLRRVKEQARFRALSFGKSSSRQIFRTRRGMGLVLR